jgi:hypothetical protein
MSYEELAYEAYCFRNEYEYTVSVESEDERYDSWEEAFSDPDDEWALGQALGLAKEEWEKVPLEDIGKVRIKVYNSHCPPDEGLCSDPFDSEEEAVLDKYYRKGKYEGYTGETTFCLAEARTLAFGLHCRKHGAAPYMSQDCEAVDAAVKAAESSAAERNTIITIPPSAKFLVGTMRDV